MHKSLCISICVVDFQLKTIENDIQNIVHHKLWGIVDAFVDACLVHVWRNFETHFKKRVCLHKVIVFVGIKIILCLIVCFCRASKMHQACTKAYVLI